MKTEITINVRLFPVTIEDERTQITTQDSVVLEKSHLQAAQLVGQSSKELIHRIYNRQGFKVVEIGTPERRTISVNLEELYRLHTEVVQIDPNRHS